MDIHLCQHGTLPDFNRRLAISRSLSPVDILGVGQDMKSDARYYRRRAIEERMAAQRAVTEQARAWHAKLAHDFAQRADSSGSLLGA